MSSSFGPGALATPANAITVARLLVAPLLFVSITAEPSWALLGFWFVLCATDGVDGYLARRHGTTRSGAFLDPLADKVLVLGALFALVRHGVFPWPPVALIALREIGISVYRSVAGRSGVSVPASQSAKLKTVVQQFSVAFVLCPPIREHLAWLAPTTLWVAVALTLTSGWAYVRAARQRPVAAS